jgi:hypothetical protein
MENSFEAINEMADSGIKLSEGLHEPMSEESRSLVLLIINEIVKNPNTSPADVHALIKEILQGTIKK